MVLAQLDGVSDSIANVAIFYYRNLSMNSVDNGIDTIRLGCGSNQAIILLVQGGLIGNNCIGTIRWRWGSNQAIIILVQLDGVGDLIGQ
jgi:hypothetical protein